MPTISHLYQILIHKIVEKFIRYIKNGLRTMDSDLYQLKTFGRKWRLLFQDLKILKGNTIVIYHGLKV